VLQFRDGCHYSQRGKFHFGYIYGFATIGGLAIYILLSLLSTSGVSVYTVFSVLGYCLLPVLPLGFVSLFLSLRSGWFADLEFSVYFFVYVQRCSGLVLFRYFHCMVGFRGHALLYHDAAHPGAAMVDWIPCCIVLYHFRVVDCVLSALNKLTASNTFDITITLRGHSV